MKIIGAFLIVIGLFAAFNAAPLPPGTDPAYAAGHHLGPFLFMAAGGGLLVLASKRDA